MEGVNDTLKKTLRLPPELTSQIWSFIGKILDVVNRDPKYENYTKILSIWNNTK